MDSGGSRNHVLDGVQITLQRGNFEGELKGRPSVKLGLPAVNSAKTAEPIEMPFAAWTRVGPGKHVLDGGTHWRNLANTTEPSMCKLL